MMRCLSFAAFAASWAGLLSKQLVIANPSAVAQAIRLICVSLIVVPPMYEKYLSWGWVVTGFAEKDGQNGRFFA
jgi:hypothetical protein